MIFSSLNPWKSPRGSIRLLLVILFIVLPNTSETAPCRADNESIVKCEDGVVLPKWQPSFNLSTGDRVARAIVYFASLMYMFLGVSIIADRFMAAIEVITSQEREVTIKMKNGEKQVVSVRIWNETVSNLTLMALGSSAPEILLSIIEICGKNFNAGDLGPGTIVGSAAFNLFVIIGLCIIVVPNGECRRIKHLSVFFITATWSIFAYLWMYLIIAVFSPNEIQVWEGLVTFACFPLTVLTAYVADTKIFVSKFLPAKYRATRLKALGLNTEDNVEMQANHNADGAEVTFRDGTGGQFGGEEEEVHEFEKHRMEYIEVLRDIRKRHPNIDTKQLEEMAQMEVLNRGPKSRAFYRMQATRTLTGGGNVIKKSKVERRLSLEQDLKVIEEDPHTQKIFFDPGHYTVMENVGTFYVTVTRTGGSMETTVSVDYATEDGTATAGDDYVSTSGAIIFYPGEAHKQIPVTIIDDEIFEEDEHFYIRLSNVKVMEERHYSSRAASGGGDIPMKVQLTNPSTATIMVLDDDHSGVFNFENKELQVSESQGNAGIKVLRSSGARGVVRVPFQTIEGTAHGGGKDYEDSEGFLEFQNDQTEAIIYVPIVDDNQYEKSEFFFVQLGEPQLLRKNDSSFFRHHRDPVNGNGDNNEEDTGKPRLGDTTKIEVHIKESMEFKNTVDHLLKAGKWSLVVGTSSWKEQFIEAITVSAEKDEGGDQGEDEEEKLPSCMDYVMHFLTIFWKVLFAFVPPTDYIGGWLCFCVSISMIGVLTAVIGDLASGFGCTVGLSDAVTAISFVALGTSLPDTFASKVAAIGDTYADSSIGNVTGSNAVNVFLGIGIAWAIAAIVHAFRGTTFHVKAGSLGFSVTVFCIFALFAIALLLIRRRRGGELGGPVVFKYVCGCFLFCLWIAYIILAALENYCHIRGF